MSLTPKQKFVDLFFRQQYEEALKIPLNILKIQPKNPQALEDAGVCCTYLNRYQEAYDYYIKALKFKPNHINLLDGLAHVSLGLSNIDNVRKYGLQALQLKDADVPHSDWQPFQLRKQFKPHKRLANIISFSLFGSLPKYCETAILNAQQQKYIYPEWTCRFYVDDSVPQHVKQRLLEAGSQVVEVSDEEKQKLTGTMWRFLAFDDPTVDFVLFRDCDSIITEREAKAVKQWLDSDKYFHMMRDFASHTDLILAGMWAGVTSSSLPKLKPLMIDYCQSEGKHPTHADQMFLKHSVWQYMRNSVLQHDSYFSFLGGVEFPDGFPSLEHVGNDQSAGSFTADMNVAEGTILNFGLKDMTAQPPEIFARYQTVIHGKKLKIYLPKSYIQAINQQKISIVQF